jgi:hypothetical protein
LQILDYRLISDPVRGLIPRPRPSPCKSSKCREGILRYAISRQWIMARLRRPGNGLGSSIRVFATDTLCWQRTLGDRLVLTRGVSLTLRSGSGYRERRGWLVSAVCVLFMLRSDSRLWFPIKRQIPALYNSVETPTSPVLPAQLLWRQ